MAVGPPIDLDKAYAIMDAVSNVIEQLPALENSGLKGNRLIHFDPEVIDGQAAPLRSKESTVADQQMKEIIEISNSSWLRSIHQNCPEAARRADSQPAGVREGLHFEAGPEQAGNQAGVKGVSSRQ